MPHNPHSSVELATVVPDSLSLWMKYSNSRTSLEDRTELYASLVSLIKAEYPLDDTLQDQTVHFLKSLYPILCTLFHIAIYRSLVAMVKAEYPFDNALQDKAARFLKSLEPDWCDLQHAEKLVYDLVPSSSGSTSGFVESIVTLVSSPHSTVVAAALSLLTETAMVSTPTIQSRLVESDLVTNVFATLQPQTLPITGNEEIFDNLIKIVLDCINITFPPSLRNLGITTAVDQFNRREMIFQKVVLPSREEQLSGQGEALSVLGQRLIRMSLLVTFQKGFDQLFLKFID
ncbi:hypothetical protein BLNAU_4926 [Blattamonas nauphoetae]|uniref:Uncharacterized protein n=1 Tax=Blattamonas nauphoetae TaxID=2049346 RepID=A0ABQ9Y8F4_9EUKA|nr:hypothetical protein BLNAU_4926 [Blattamonas nauphoetae]